MRMRPCRFESSVRAMARTGAGSAELRGHVDTCVDCRETVQVAAWLRHVAQSERDTAPLPDPVGLWWKARLVARWEAERLATAALDRGTYAQAIIGAAGCLALGWVLWPHLDQFSLQALVASPRPFDVASPRWAAALLLSGLAAMATAWLAIRTLLRS